MFILHKLHSLVNIYCDIYENSLCRCYKVGNTHSFLNFVSLSNVAHFFALCYTTYDFIN